MLVQVYECQEGSITAIEHDHPSKDLLIGENAKMIRQIVGRDWNHCMKIHHELMGWEPYKPFE